MGKLLWYIIGKRPVVNPPSSISQTPPLSEKSFSRVDKDGKTLRMHMISTRPVLSLLLFLGLIADIWYFLYV